ncbi:MAG: carbohydrate porin, partial [Rhodocyclaceae bacterium]|nr:carbohydrate porin [Rhodocyclaceae bacterium]
ALDPRASGTERIGEIYYRFRVNSLFELTPDFQFIQRPGGDGGAPTVKVVGLRAKLGF